MYSHLNIMNTGNIVDVTPPDELKEVRCLQVLTGLRERGGSGGPGWEQAGHEAAHSAPVVCLVPGPHCAVHLGVPHIQHHITHLPGAIVTRNWCLFTSKYFPRIRE